MVKLYPQTQTSTGILPAPQRGERPFFSMGEAPTTQESREKARISFYNTVSTSFKSVEQ
jgi:hypothetical protein